MIKAIIFDYGGILTDHGTFRGFYKPYCTKYKCNEEELEALFTKYWKKARLGSIDSRLLWEKIAALVHLPVAQVRHEWITWFGNRGEIYPLLSKLKQNYTLALLSNQIKDWMEEVKKQQHLSDFFTIIILSYEVKLAKPDHQIFALLLQRLKLKPEECIFIDDQETNISAAALFGFKTIRFVSVEQLKRDLQVLGVAI